MLTESVAGRVLLSRLLIILLAAFSMSAAHAQEGETLAIDQITDNHVYQQVGVLRNEIEQIRLLVGERPPRSRSFRVSDVQPRQVYFQAQTLFRKANQLAQEIAGVSRQAPATAPDREIVAGDVYQMLSAARDQLQVVRGALQVNEPVQVPDLPRNRQMSDVMLETVMVMDVFNTLIQERADWPGIYDRLVQIITYAGGAVPEDSRYPQLPAHECCKMPQDVIVVLLEAMERVRPVAEDAGLTVVRVESMEAEEGGASTDTVYDLTTTLVTDFAELTLRIGGDDIAPPDYPRPARIFPSHAFQLAQVFDKLVDQILVAHGADIAVR